MSQVVTLRFSVMPKLDVLLEQWNSRGTIRHLSATAFELRPANAEESIVVDYRAEEKELFVEGSFCETTWEWLNELRERYRGTLCEEEVGPDDAKARLEWQRLSWYWKALVVVGIALLLPLLLPLSLCYAAWQLGRLAFKLKK